MAGDLLLAYEMLAEGTVVLGGVSVPLEMVVQTGLAVQCLPTQLTPPPRQVRARAEDNL